MTELPPLPEYCEETGCFGYTDSQLIHYANQAVEAYKRAVQHGIPDPVGVVTSMVKGGVTWQTWPDQLPDGTKLYTDAALDYVNMAEHCNCGLPPVPSRERVVVLTLDELEMAIAALRVEHHANDFEPECPACTAVQKLEAAARSDRVAA